MEDRCTPANVNLTVTTASDVVNANDGALSLREAINDANANVPTTFHTISFAAGVQGQTITLDPSEGELLIKENMHIGSSSMTAVTIQRDNTSVINHRIFHIGDGTNTPDVELYNLVIKYGKLTTGNGAGIYVQGNGIDVQLHDCTVSYNTADGSGGGIAINGNSTSLITWETDISYNESTENNGGGIYFLGDSASMLTLHDTTVSNNKSGFNGGGIYTTAGVNTLDNVLVSLNETQNKGGGIYAAPSGMTGVISFIDGTTLDQNKCLNSDTSQRKGGGIYLATGSLTMGWSGTTTISNNTATTGNGVYLASGTSVSKNDGNITWTNNTLYDEDNP